MSLRSRFRINNLKRKLLRAAHVMGPTLLALAFAGTGSSVAHAQKTMDFSGAQTLMTTFKTESTLRNILTAVEAPLYDIGVLSDRGMLPGLDSIPAAAVLDRFRYSSSATLTAPISMSVLQVSIVSPC